MAIDLARLRSVTRGEITPKNGVTGVAALQTECVTPEKARCNARNACNASKTVRSEKSYLGVVGGVTEGVSEALPSPAFDPEALQAEAERWNREVALAMLTDRF
jgi:hypothetical protein